MSETLTLKKEAKVDDPLVEIRIDLPAHSSIIRIDGREYYHGMTYKVKQSQLATFNEIMGNAWRHEQEVHGQRKPFDMRHRPHTISAR
ncbi:MAG: hypothetical protein KGL63_06640 [Betaproteobacteria bacterium]|nr:hypothetical protein [Betaproteobacteria bacterium]